MAFSSTRRFPMLASASPGSRLLAATVASAALVLAAAPSVAQQPPQRPAAPARPPAAPAAPAPAAPAAPQADAPQAPPGNWVKICNADPATKKEICLTTQELRAETGALLASVALREIQGEARKVLLVAVPTGMLIQPGLGVGIDKGKPEQAKFTICAPNACFAEYVASDKFIADMKKSNVLVLTTFNQQAKPVQFPLGLAGFKSTHEGPAIDPNKLRAQQEELRKQLEEEAEKQRQRLRELQQQQQPQ